MSRLLRSARSHLRGIPAPESQGGRNFYLVADTLFLRATANELLARRLQSI